MFPILHCSRRVLSADAALLLSACVDVPSLLRPSVITCRLQEKRESLEQERRDFLDNYSLNEMLQHEVIPEEEDSLTDHCDPGTSSSSS